MMVLIVGMYNDIWVQQSITIRIELYTCSSSVLEGSLMIKFKEIFLKEMVGWGNAVKNS